MSRTPIPKPHPIARARPDWPDLGHVTILELVRKAVSPSYITWTKMGQGKLTEENHGISAKRKGDWQ